MIKDLFAHKKSKIILIGSWILAGIFLIVGIVFATRKSNEGVWSKTSSSYSTEKAYDGTVYTISLNSEKSFYDSEVMYEFHRNYSSANTYTITVGSNAACTLYVLNDNRQSEITDGEYVCKVKFSGGTNKESVNLGGGYTYYIYVKGNYNTDYIHVKISEGSTSK